MSFHRIANFNARVAESTTLDSAAPLTDNVLALTNIVVKCNTDVTLTIWDNTTTSTRLFEVDLLGDEGYAYTWTDENPLIFSTNSVVAIRLSVTGTVSDINIRGFQYRPGF